MTEESLNTGVVSWFNNQTGFGFIARDNGEKDLFIHWTNIDMEGFKTLEPGMVVSFEIGENHRGPQAINIKVLSMPDQDYQEQDQRR